MPNRADCWQEDEGGWQCEASSGGQQDLKHEPVGGTLRLCMMHSHESTCILELAITGSGSPQPVQLAYHDKTRPRSSADEAGPLRSRREAS
jgi:hypothetical protein